MATKEDIKGKVIIIENTQPRGIVLPKDDWKLDGVPTRLTLLPGENNVSEDAWKRAVKRYYPIRMWIACGYMKNKGPGEARSFAKGLDVLTRSQSIEQIMKCNEVKVLKDWKEKTVDPDVKKMCVDKIRELCEYVDGGVER